VDVTINAPEVSGDDEFSIDPSEASDIWDQDNNVLIEVPR
jgi:hypothetical protein